MTTLNDLIDDWSDALWKEYPTAYARGHMDASHDIEADYWKTVALGVDAYLGWLYSAPKNARYTWMDEEVDALSSETEFRARLVVTARDEGFAAAVLLKLAHVPGSAA